MKQVLVPYFHTDGKRWDHFYSDSVTKIIYFSKRHNGKRIKFSCFTDNGVNAKKFANREFDKRIGKHKTHARNLIKEEIALFRKVKEGENNGKGTMVVIHHALLAIEEFWGDKFPNEITPDNIADWYIWWAENKTGQMENAIKYMRNFCKYLSQKVVNGYPLLPAIPAIKDPNAKKVRAARKKKKENIFSAADFKAIYSAASSREDRLLALIMYTMATRITETLNLAFDQEIILNAKQPLYRWRVDQNKAELDGYHALHPSLIKPLTEMKAIRDGEGTKLLFPQLRDKNQALWPGQIEWKEWEKRAGLPYHWSAHTFRHTCLSNLFNEPSNPHLLICKLYRISLQEAADTYVKPTAEGIDRMHKILRVEI